MVTLVVMVYFAFTATTACREIFELLGSQDKRPFLKHPPCSQAFGSGPARWMF
jgi:hypothetical protein